MCTEAGEWYKIRWKKKLAPLSGKSRVMVEMVPFQETVKSHFREILSEEGSEYQSL